MDEENIQSHIQQGDELGTDAAIVDLIRQDIEKRGYRKEHGDALERVKDRLVYLQNHYKLRRDES
jgi:hypothetical protein